MRINGWAYGWVLGVLLAGFTTETLAQFYAPDTDYHDLVQRQFVVELARVLAWRENRAGGKIAEITYEIASDSHRVTTWKLKWLDAQGRTVREMTVQYPETQLTAGAQFYRAVYRQLAPRPPVGPLSETDLLRGYWEGAERTGLSRTESLQAAFALAKIPEPKAAPQLAGLLAHAALPSLAGTTMLDAVLLARAAAWLCVAESAVQNRTAASDGLWTPILFLAARENAAAEAWKKSAMAAHVAARGSEAVAWWDFLLRRPRSEEVFVRVAEHRRWAMPLLVYYGRLFRYEAMVARVIEPLFDDESQPLARLYDYAPLFALEAGVGGGRIMEGRWPSLARQAWIECLRDFQPEPQDYTGYLPVLQKIPREAAPTAETEQQEERVDASVSGFAEAAPLIDLGFREGTGTLIPVGIVTARDLLNYGWEMTGAQLSARWYLVARMWGVPERADSIARTVMPRVAGLEFCFCWDPWNYIGKDPDNWKLARAKLQDWTRLQFLDCASAWLVNRFAWHPSNRENVEMFIRRCWLRPANVRFQHSALWHAKAYEQIVPNLRRLHQEGGTLLDAALLHWIAWDLSTGDAKVPHIADFKAEIANTLWEPSWSQLQLNWSDWKKRPDFERAQELEKLFWQRPGNSFPFEEIFDGYLRARAYASARRFFDQIEDLIEDRVRFSNHIGPRRFTLALMEQDLAGMEHARRVSSSGSYLDMIANIVACAAADDIAGLQEQVETVFQRYDKERKNEMMLKLEAFLPLIPALKDPAHPDHGKALDFFATYKNWPTLQWTWLTKYKLSTADAVRFLGGPQTDPERRLMVMYLLKDKEGFRKAYEAAEKDFRARGKTWGNMAFVVIHYLRNELLDVPVPTSQPDLKPPTARSLTEAFHARLREVTAAKTAATLAQYKTADQLWAHLDTLRKHPPQQADTTRLTLAAYRKFLLALESAATEFQRRYPADPRRWEAQLIRAELAAHTQSFSEEEEPVRVEPLLKEIATAPDAPAPTRAAARFILIQRHAAALDETSPRTALKALDAEILAFVGQHPTDPRVGPAQFLRATLLDRIDPAGAESLWKLLSQDPNPKLVAAARAQLAARELLKKPLTLKFTAVDGRAVDLAMLRGKVVLLHFWVIWNPASRNEIPQLLELHQKYHDRGLEIIGVVLDEDKETVQRFIRQCAIPWPQRLDPGEGANSLVATYGITAIPRKWLINKNGIVVNLHAHHPLETEIQQLLAD